MIKKLKTAITVLALILIPMHQNSYSLETESSDKSDIIDNLANDLNIHYTGKYCEACHKKKPQENGEDFLRFNGDYNKLCKCHDNSLGNYIHPVGIKPSESKLNRMPSNFPLKNGELWCNTCHDIKLQCIRAEKTNSLRGAPYENRTAFCFNCHDEKNYMMYDIHKQIDDKGELIDEKCITCHTEQPDPDYDLYGDVKLVEDMEAVCQGCHVITATHPKNYNHMIKPSPKGMVTMKAAEEKYGIFLPLDKNGKMTCVTCHNPHEKGVIPEDKPAAKGADSKFRHRTPNICEKCHMF